MTCRDRIGSIALTATLTVGLAWTLGIGSSAAQGTAAVRKAAPAQPKTAAPAKGWPPKLPDGQPDITAVWGSDESGIYSLNYEPLPYLRTLGMLPQAGGAQGGGGPVHKGVMEYAKGKSIVVDPPNGVIPYQPWALERRNSVMKEYGHPKPWQIDTQTRGWPNGVPRENVYSTLDSSIGGPIQIMQPPGYVVFMYETHHEFRVVPLDGRPQPSKDIKLWEGSSRGHWEGNTLVIDVTNQNDSTRYDVIGDFHSDEVHVTERWEFVDKDTLKYRGTIDDPRIFTRPWTVGMTFKRGTPDQEIMEYAGVEGEIDVHNAEEIQKTREKQGK